MTTDSESNLTGAEFDLANAGYTPMPDPQRGEQEAEIGSDSASLREAAAQRSNSQDKIVVRRYTDAKGRHAAQNEAVTLARASRDYASATAADRRAKEQEASDALAVDIDSLRAVIGDKDPEAAEFYGFEAPEWSEDDEGPQTNPSNEADERGQDPAHLDPDVERLMQHPQVRLALEEKVGEVERARQSYVEGLGAAVQIAQANFVSQFPELTGLAPEQLPAALAQMARQDPERFSRVQAIIAGSEQLLARQQQEMQRQTEATRHGFRSYAATEDARLETMLKEEPREVRKAVAQEIVSSAKASGIEADELHRLFESEPLMRNATFQRMMYDAGKYRLMMKAKEAIAARPVPPVQRPGMSTTRGEREQSDLRTLSARLSNSGDIKDAVALYEARKAGRG